MPVAVCLFQQKKDKDWVTPKAGMGADAIRCSAVGANWDSRLPLETHRVFKEYTEKFSHS